MSEKRFGLKELGIGTLIYAASACGVPQDSAQPAGSGSDDDFTSVHELLAAPCTFDASGNPTITLGNNETAYLFKRAADGNVVANTVTSTGAECTFATTKKITLTATAATDNHKILIDYYSGTFGMATAAFSAAVMGSGPKTVVTMVGTNSQVKFRGTANADTFTFGTLSTTSYLALGVGSSATMAATARTYPDVSMTGVTDLVVSAGPGNDVITGQGGLPIGGTVAAPGALAGTIPMTVYGGDGNDTITSGAAGAAVNHLYGENGNDTFLQQAAKAKDVISGTNAGGAADTDVVDYSVRTAALTITLGDDAAATAAAGSITTGADTTFANNDHFTINDGTTAKVFEYKVSGTGWTPTAGAVLIDISAGSLTADLVAAATLTAIQGAGLSVTAAQPDITTGDLTITLPAGAKPAAAHINTVVGTGLTVVDFAGGSAAVTANDGESGELDSLNADIENVIGGSAADRIDASLATLNAHVLQGMAGDDTLIGSALADTLWGGPGDDTLKGGAQVDTLNGGDGNDTLQGGAGNDNIDGGGLNCVASSSAVCTVTFAAKGAAAVNPGINTLDFADRDASTPVTVDLSMLMAAAQVGASGEKDVVTASSVQYLRGGAGDDTLSGDANANIIWGGGGADTINGNDGNDALYGEAGDDTISGGNGDDFISGGAGGMLQTLNGDAGDDFIDNTAGTGGTVDCGGGTTDVLLTNGTETATNCE